MRPRKPETSALLIALAGILIIAAFLLIDLTLAHHRDLEEGKQRGREPLAPMTTESGAMMRFTMPSAIVWVRSQPTSSQNFFQLSLFGSLTSEA